MGNYMKGKVYRWERDRGEMLRNVKGNYEIKC